MKLSDQIRAAVDASGLSRYRIAKEYEERRSTKDVKTVAEKMQRVENDLSAYDYQDVEFAQTDRNYGTILQEMEKKEAELGRELTPEESAPYEQRIEEAGRRIERGREAPQERRAGSRVPNQTEDKNVEADIKRTRKGRPFPKSSVARRFLVEMASVRLNLKSLESAVSSYQKHIMYRKRTKPVLTEFADYLGVPNTNDEFMTRSSLVQVLGEALRQEFITSARLIVTSISSQRTKTPCIS